MKSVKYIRGDDHQGQKPLIRGDMYTKKSIHHPSGSYHHSEGERHVLYYFPNYHKIHSSLFLFYLLLLFPIVYNGFSLSQIGFFPFILYMNELLRRVTVSS